MTTPRDRSSNQESLWSVRSDGGFLLRAYSLVGVLAITAWWAPTLPMPGLLPLTLLLAAPAMLCLWHRTVVRGLLAVRQFQPGRGLFWLGSRRVLAYFLDAGLAIGLTLLALMHAAFFGAREWSLLTAMPVVFVLGRRASVHWLAPQFAGAVYTSRGTTWVAGWCVVVLYLAGWVALAVAEPHVPAAGLLERVEALQAQWKGAPSATAQWLAHFMAWADAGTASIGSLGEGPAWRVAFAVVLAPVATVAFVALGFKGLALPSREVRRIFGPGPSAADEPPGATPAGVAAWAVVIVVSVLVLVQAVASLEQRLRSSSNPLALERVPECEAIDGKVYKLGTLALLTEALGAGTAASERAREASCRALDAARAAAEKGVDAYLDWYYSLPAEWGRIAAMLKGDLEKLLQNELQARLSASSGWSEALAAAQAGGEAHVVALDSLRVKAKEILRDNVLVKDESACHVVRRASIEEALRLHEAGALRLRAAGGAAAALAAGAVAAKVAAKAMTKASMKTAVKLLAKFAAKRAAAVGTSVATGAAVGSVVPGLGTAVGAGVGFVVGLGVSVAADFGALALEEHFERTKAKDELMESLAETLAPMRQVSGCAP